MVKFNLFLTAKCNWSCEYCFRGDSNVMKTIDPKTNDRILKYAPVIASLTDNVFFTGGEMGTVKPSILDFLFETFKEHTIRLATNGAWFKTPSFKKYKDRDDLHILYHCVENLTDEIEYETVDVPRVKWDFVVTEDNWRDMKIILEKYPHITFYPIFDIRKSTCLSASFYKQVYDFMSQYDNIPDQIKQATKSMGTGDAEWTNDILTAKPYRYRVDFNANKITTCCIPEVGIPITKENLTAVANRKVDLPVDDKICSYCVVRWMNKSDDIKNPIV